MQARHLPRGKPQGIGDDTAEESVRLGVRLANERRQRQGLARRPRRAETTDDVDGD